MTEIPPPERRSREPRGALPEARGQFRQPTEQVGCAPRLELFGRRQTPGWVVWGNEVERDQLHQGVEELLDAEEVDDDCDE